MSQALYIWANGVAPSLQVSSFSDAEKTAYSLYREAKFNTAADPTGSIQQWIDYVAAQLGNSDYADHFPDALVAEARRLQKQLSQQPQAVVELDMLMREGGGEALDRVLYEGIQRFKLSVYDYRYPLWRNGDNQLPADGVGRVLAGLPALTADIQHIDLDNLEVPRNTRAAAEFMYNWLKQHPVTKDFEGEWGKDSASGAYDCIFSQAVGGIKKKITVGFLDLSYIAPSLIYTIDFSDLYLWDDKGLSDLKKLFTYDVNVVHLIRDSGTPQKRLNFLKAGNRWDRLIDMKDGLNEIGEWISYVILNFSNERRVSDFLNYNSKINITFSERDYRPFLKIAATVQDPNLPQIYQQWLDKIPLENEAARNKLISFYENDIAEISRIVAAKKQGN